MSLVAHEKAASAASDATPLRRKADVILPILIFGCLLCVPFIARLGSESYVLSLMTRVVILATAAIALDLLIGQAGMISLGHAAYLGIGTYAVGILAAHGITNIAIIVPLALVAGVIFSFATGIIAIRSQGAYFIMITLAFGQMLFFVVTALAQYGGDDGMTLSARSDLFGIEIFKSDRSLYFVAFGFLLAMYLLLRRIVHSHFGRVLAGTRENEVRMQAIGFKPMQYRLCAYVIAGTVTALAGVLLANQANFVSPSTMAWQRSAELMFIVVLGGVGSLHGVILGAAVFLIGEEYLAQWTEHWPIVFGPLLILTVFFARNGLIALFPGSGRRL